MSDLDSAKPAKDVTTIRRKMTITRDELLEATKAIYECEASNPRCLSPRYWDELEKKIQRRCLRSMRVGLAVLGVKVK